ncbi:hypothetical protein K474DRAFT_1703372 [Panus rudis PR-1116 ss-1]|nr:hypothetical protein K474DRAFT_1703372 [Panus rudis PR-1116 ss-1]
MNSDLESLAGSSIREGRKRRITYDQSAPVLLSSKRRRTETLNSRFDRMIETANIVHRSSTGLTKNRRRRAASASGSSSTASCDLPRTPVDAYSGHDEGRLGQTFSVVKLKPSTRDYDIPIGTPERIYRAEKLCEGSHAYKEPVPDWLCQTVSRLNRDHPLRALFPSQPLKESPYLYKSSSTLLPRDSGGVPAVADVVPNEERVFAFMPPQTFEQYPPFPPQPNIDHDLNERFSSHILRPDSASMLFDPPNNLEPSFAHGQHIDPAPSTTPGPLGSPATLLADEAPPPALNNSNLIAVKPTPIDVSASLTTPLSMYPSTDPGNTPKTDNDEARYVSIAASIDSFAHLPSTDEQSDYSLSDLLHSSSSDFYEAPGDKLSQLTLREEPGIPYLSKTVHNPPMTNHPSFDEPVAAEMIYAKFNAPSEHPPRTPTVHRVYFDFPTEDPSDPASDPLEPHDYELDVDYNELNFTWKKYDTAADTALKEYVTAANTGENLWLRQAKRPEDDHDVPAMRETPLESKSTTQEQVVRGKKESSISPHTSRQDDLGQDTSRDEDRSVLSSRGLEQHPEQADRKVNVLAPSPPFVDLLATASGAHASPYPTTPLRSTRHSTIDNDGIVGSSGTRAARVTALIMKRAEGDHKPTSSSLALCAGRLPSDSNQVVSSSRPRPDTRSFSDSLEQTRPDQCDVFDASQDSTDSIESWSNAP